MSRKKDIDLDLTGFAELFMNDEGRAESRLPRIYDIPLRFPKSRKRNITALMSLAIRTVRSDRNAT